MPSDPEDRVESYPQDHGPYVLRGRRFEEVGAAAGAVADVVAHEVGDDGRVPPVVLRDARLDLPHEVGADVGGLRVDAAAELGEEGDEARAEAVAHDLERDLLGVLETTEEAEEPPTPRRLIDTTKRPETAPPRRAMRSAASRLVVAATAVRRFARIEIVMPT